MSFHMSPPPEIVVLVNDYVPTLEMTLCIFGSLLFLRASMAKLSALAAFTEILRNYRLLPAGWVAPAAVVVPLAEAAVAALLAIRPAQAMAAVAAALLLVMFSIAIQINLRRGRSYIDCGCGDESTRQPLDRAMVGRNLALATVFLISASGSPHDIGSAGVLLAVVAGTSFFLLYVSHESLKAMSTRRQHRLSPALRRLAWSRYKEQDT